jgi:hypothetical protein
MSGGKEGDPVGAASRREVSSHGGDAFAERLAYNPQVDRGRSAKGFYIRAAVTLAIETQYCTASFSAFLRIR